MIEQVSPLTRRIVAVGLLILVLLVGLQGILLPLASRISDQREELAILRDRAAHLKDINDRPLPPMSALPAHAAIKAIAAGPALERLRAAISQAATASGVTLNGVAPPSSAGPAQHLDLEVSATGSEEALTQFVGLLEHGDPLMRWESWRIQPGSATDQPLTLSGRVAAAWERTG